MTRKQKCIAELWKLLRRIDDGARHHDVSLLRALPRPSGCDMYQGLPPICRLMDDIWERYGDIINEALNAMSE